MIFVLKSEVILILLITLSTVISQDKRNGIIEVKNKTHIYCVSEENTELSMFTSPPLNKTKDAENLMETVFWKNDDWVKTYSNDIKIDLLDRRWEDFKIKKMKYLRFTDLKTSVSFSVYGKEEIGFFADNGESLDYFQEQLDNQWTTFTFTINEEEGSLHYFKNDFNLRSISLIPTQLVVKTENETYFKLHNYTYKEARNVTKEKPTTLTFTNSEKSCLIIYVSLCNSCILEVKTTDGSINIASQRTNNNHMEQWQTHKIMLNRSTSNEVVFMRKMNNSIEHNNRMEDVYWKLDVRLQNNEINKVTYLMDDNSPEQTYICKYLQFSDKSQQFKRERQDASSDCSVLPTDCGLGMLGVKCDISCESVLGHQYERCENHKICSEGGCQCAWGYTGEWCTEECQDGKWGLNCQRNCDNDCRPCNKQTGECQHTLDGGANGTKDGAVVYISLLVLLVLLVVAKCFVILFLLYLLKRKKKLLKITSLDVKKDSTDIPLTSITQNK